MKAPVGLLSDRTVLRSKMEGPRPDKFTFAQRSGAMKAPVGLLSDRTVLRKQDGGASPRQVPILEKSNLTLEEAAAYSGIGILELSVPLSAVRGAGFRQIEGVCAQKVGCEAVLQHAGRRAGFADLYD